MRSCSSHAPLPSFMDIDVHHTAQPFIEATSQWGDIQEQDSDLDPATEQPVRLVTLIRKRPFDLNFA